MFLVVVNQRLGGSIHTATAEGTWSDQLIGMKVGVQFIDGAIDFLSKFGKQGGLIERVILYKGPKTLACRASVFLAEWR
ncbi:hypothetical protein [Rhizobium sp. BR 315]|uniref:hypothetical protein n=1 Tax=Rhizobium sp. BR 315 TaxID=3040014 RepID=UPI003D358A71